MNPSRSQVSSPDSVIRRTNQPINNFKNQIYLKQGTIDSTENITIEDGRKTKITFSSTNSLISNIKSVLNLNQINAINCTLELLSQIQTDLLKAYPEFKILHTTTSCKELNNEVEIVMLIEKTHNRARRSYVENLEQVKFEYWFKNMKKRFKEKVINL